MIKLHTTIESELLFVKPLHLHEQYHYFIIYALITCCSCITRGVNSGQRVRFVSCQGRGIRLNGIT